MPAEPDSTGGLADAGGWRAVVFDVDGTLVDSERDGHRVAFNAAFEAGGLPYRWDVPTYGRLLAITGGRRRIAAFLRERGHDDSEAADLAARLHQDKTSRMRDFILNGLIGPRPGVTRLLDELGAAGIPLAVATTGTRDWAEPLVDRLFGLDRFAVVLTGTEVTALKPDPAVYTEAVRRLDVPPKLALAVEDSANGLRSATAAGLPCVVVTNGYTAEQDFTGAAAVYDGFEPCLADRSGPVWSGPRLRAG
ncbi:MAG: HAD-IA family hydrolase [Nocardiopsaceae bacterium]|nr:HAD-IA family hydrolase [Nocardiopsaceae bacterium]